MVAPGMSCLYKKALFFGLESEYKRMFLGGKFKVNESGWTSSISKETHSSRKIGTGLSPGSGCTSKLLEFGKDPRVLLAAVDS